MQDQKFDPQQSFAEALRCYSEGRLEDALFLLETLLKRVPQGGPRWFAILGNIHLKLGNQVTAADAFVREAEQSPDMAAMLLKNAMLLYNEHGLQQQVVDIARAAIAANPGDSGLAMLAVSALHKFNRLDEAAPYIPLLDMKQPRQAATAYDYHVAARDAESAYSALTTGLEFSPNDGYLMATRHAEARNVLDFATMRDYANLMAQPEAPLSRTLLSIERALNRLYWSTSEELNARPAIETLEITNATARHQPLTRRAFSPRSDRIRIGYLSNDFYDHVVMSVLMDVLKQHDPEKFEFYLFCHTFPNIAVAQQKWPAAIRERIIDVYDRDSLGVAREISDRQIDILVDLKGHTGGARMDIVNLSDAPVKAGYLGYPSGTTGVDLDYIIADRYVTPDSSKPHYHEKLCRLPGSLMPNRPLASLKPEPTDRKSAGLPEGRFVFCSFNALIKLSLDTIGMWARILRESPDALLWIRCDPPLARRNLLTEMQSHGVDPEQILFASGVPSYEDHITRLAMADLALDPTPYNGHVTTTDMLRAGLPVLTVRGSTCSSRMTEGQLSVLGMSDLIAADADEYVRRAVAFAHDPAGYAAMRRKLTEARDTSPLFDPEHYTRNLERAFEMMAERARTGLPADHIDVPAGV